MAKYLVTSGSYYDPFTYEELSKPITQTVEAHNAAQDVYDQLGMETSALERYITDNPGDQEAKRMYDSYMSRLNSLQGNLWRSGYNASTRRDLSAARTGYASNITRLQAAIQARQDRSKEYWDAKHKNPNLVTSGDPGLYGLDDYLHNENQGMDWFSYDSTQFEKEVYEEINARAKTMLRDITETGSIPDHNGLASQLTRVINKGVTYDEANSANNLVDKLIDMSPEERERYYQTNAETVSPIVKMLTETLINKYNATGIRGYDVSPSERAKLIARGKSGLTLGGIVEPEVKDFENPEYDFQSWKRKKEWEYANDPSKNGTGNGSGNGSGNGGKGGKEPGTYTLNSLASYVETMDTKKLNEIVNKNFYQIDEPINIKDANGNPDQITSAYDAQRIMDSFGVGKRNIKNMYGIDADNPTGMFTVLDGNGNERKIRVRYRQYADDLATSWEYPETIYNKKNPGSDYIYEYQDEKGHWVVDTANTVDLNKDIAEYKDALKKFKESNPGVDLEKLGVPEKNWEKMKTDYNIPDEVPRELYPHIMNTLAKQGEITPAYLADSSPQMANMRENYASSLIEAYSRANKDKRGDVDKGNRDVVLYKVLKNGSRTMERNYAQLFGTDANGKIKKDVIDSIGMTPEDVIANEFSFTMKGSQYVGNPRALGNDVNSIVENMRSPVYASYKNEETGQNVVYPLDEKGAIHYMMLPIVDPIKAVTMNEEEVTNWINYTDKMLRHYTSLVSTDQDGNIIGAVTPTQIVMSPSMQQMLRNAVTRYIDDALSASRDTRNQMGFVNMSSSGSNPPSYYVPQQ